MESQKILKEVTAAFKKIVKELNLHPTRLDIELTAAETIHVYLTAPEFSGKNETERDLMVWRALKRKLSNRALIEISVCELLAPAEEAEEKKLQAA